MKFTGICYNCRMKIPKGARICPYCHTEHPDLAGSTMEEIVFTSIAVGLLILWAIFAIFIAVH